MSDETNDVAAGAFTCKDCAQPGLASKMGIKDLATTLTKHAPQAITPLRSLSHLQGQTVAIDASVLTGKLHFSRPTQAHPSQSSPSTSDANTISRTRIVQGWYTFLRALSKAGIKPIVVFDGPTRLAAKANENRRRLEARELQKGRSGVEWNRGERLRETLEGWRRVGERDWQEIRKRFRETVLKGVEDGRVVVTEQAAWVSDSASDPLSTGTLEPPRPTAEPLSTLPITPPPPPPPPLWETVQAEAEKTVVDAQEDVVELPQEDDVEFEEEEESSSVSDSAASDPLSTGTLESAAHPISDHPSTLLRTPPPPLPDAVLTTVLSLAELHARFQADATNTLYSKNQTLVTEAERRWYDSILAEERSSEDVNVVDSEILPHRLTGIDIDVLESILRQSNELERSHRTRAEAVPWQASEDVLDLIRSLGIPYLKPSPTSPYEAEALCASLYHARIASLVISEDTDVIVYQAPLLRRVNSAGQNPANTDGNGEVASSKGMSVWDAEKAREGLGLSREEMIDFALLCGSDFTERIPQKYGSIEAILNSQTRYLPSDPPIYLLSVAAARQIFNDIPPLTSEDHLTLIGRDATLDAMLDDGENEVLQKWGIKGGVLRFDGMGWPTVEEVNDRQAEGEGEWLLWEEDGEVVASEEGDWEVDEAEVEVDGDVGEEVPVVGQDQEEVMARMVDEIEIDDESV
ncbi:BQ5605_C001g00236 [Microbotryum silenes-dioicae]|uniref:BQ5605_C001g00236 protein n=1 Tax=Microbotryum silenes-dioicae TaxID=796604 RepID=A0A2X0P5M3_9BASI|nr:BQ5605_C001g00236 [Microbotryum silenes-dioicae]